MTQAATASPVTTLQEISTLPDDPRWQATIDTPEQKVVFEMYSHQLPATASDGEWRPHGIGELEVWWDDEDGVYKRKRAAASRATIDLPTDQEELKHELESVLDERFESYEQSRFLKLADHADVPKPVKKRLHDRFGTLYSFLQASKAEVLAIEGMGEARWQSIQETNRAEKSSVLKWEFPSWRVQAVCPHCTEEWKQPVAAETESVAAAQGEVYCPACNRTDIPEQYLSGPFPFEP